MSKTDYTVFRQTDESKPDGKPEWVEYAKVSAANEKQAVGSAAGDKAGEYFAVPTRNVGPVREVTRETVTKVS